MSTQYINVIFPSGISSLFQPAFEEAVAFWNNVVTSGSEPNRFDADFDVSDTQCGINYVYKAGDVVNGLDIFASTPPIDGPGQILGRAGPCVYHGSILQRPLFPMLGIMEFDEADSAGLVEQGQFAAVVVHEMGHVIGIGTLWPALEGILQDPCPIFIPRPCDPYYIGANGIEGFKRLNPPSSIGPLPPVANTGGTGTANGHWREVTFENELMSGYLNAGIENPLSIMTILSLKDLGYTVDESRAEPYSVPLQARSTIDESSIELLGDMLFFEEQHIDDLVKKIGDDNYDAQFGQLFFLMIAGFFILGGLMGFLNHLSNKRLEKLLAGANVGTPSPMYRKETV